MNNETKERYDSLYAYMAASRNPDNMRAFGRVMTDMMNWFVVNKPEVANEWVDKLESIKWRNYLTPSEAEKIVDGMTPKAPWSREVWNQAMDSFGLEKEREPLFNRCAMWVTMNMIHSDSGNTIAEIMGGDVDSVDQAELVKVIHKLALDKLTDADGNFDVRRYFKL